MKYQNATVIRENSLINIDINQLVKGDFVVLQTGDFIPADITLLDSRGFEVDEFEITGEILPVKKSVDGDCFLFMGSIVTRGSARGIVVAMGEQTEYGLVTKQKDDFIKPEKIKMMDRKSILLLILILPWIIIWCMQPVHHGEQFFLFLLLSLTLMITQNDFLLQKVIVEKQKKIERKLGVVFKDSSVFEKMRTIDLICFDKTGVLTNRHVDVLRTIFLEDLISARVRKPHSKDSIPELALIACALSTDIIIYEKICDGDTIDQALISFVEKNGIDVPDLLSRYRRIHDYPFDSEQRFMAAGYEAGDHQKWFFLKGDPVVLLGKCDRYFSKDGAEKELSNKSAALINSVCTSIRRDGDTPLIMAYTTNDFHPESSRLVFLCIVHIQNSLRPETKTVIREIKKNGLKPIMLTGDREEPAALIANQCGIPTVSSLVLNGNAILKMSLSELGKQAEYCSIFAKLIPSQKGIVIRQLQSQGHQVAMVGDGFNDAIALKCADIGISFIEDSSHVARYYSQVLINDLRDLVYLVKKAAEMNTGIRMANLLRTIAAVILIVFLYLLWFF